MDSYNDLLDDEIFKRGKEQGQLRTALTVLTDMLLELNALEIYYQKPSAKSVTPAEISLLRKKIQLVKELIHSTIEVER